MDKKPKNIIDILVVDDNADNLRVLNKILDEQGYKSRSVKSGEQVFKILKVVIPDLILLDIHMPGMDGYEVCRKLKENEEYKDIPVIFISALSETFNKVLAFQVGGIDYITKPFQIEEILARIRTHLKLRHNTINLENTLKELKETQHQLILSEKMASLGILIAGIAHEINNPLNFITASIPSLERDVQLLLEFLLDMEDELTKRDLSEIIHSIEESKNEFSLSIIQDEILELLHNIKVGSERTNTIINGLRIFARMDSEKKQVEDVVQNIEFALTVLKNKYDKSITIIRKFDEVPHVHCYPGKLNQIFMNIISNSIDAIYVKDDLQTESIEISTEKAEIDHISYVVVKVRDTGIGIPETIEDKIFDPFFTTKDVGKGVGLGLSIAHSIILEHNGMVEVNSTEGEGTEVIVSFPVR